MTLNELAQKHTSEMTPLEYLIYEKFLQWKPNDSGRKNDKAGFDALEALGELNELRGQERKDIGD